MASVDLTASSWAWPRLMPTASSLTPTRSQRGGDVDVIVVQTQVRSRRAGVAVVVVGERLGLRTDRVTVPVEGLTVSSWA